jgi:hypothetical protein
VSLEQRNGQNHNNPFCPESTVSIGHLSLVILYISRDRLGSWRCDSASNFLDQNLEDLRSHRTASDPSFLRDNGRMLFFVMSQFGPYNTFIMKAEPTLAP